MKVCFFYDSVFRHGGVQRVMSLLINNLSKIYDVYIVCTEEIDKSKNVYNIDLDNITVLRRDIFKYNPKNKFALLRNRIVRNLVIIFNKNNFISKILSDLYYRNCVKNDLIEFINEEEFDVVIGAMMHFNLLLGNISNKVKAKVIGWEHNAFDAYFDEGRDFSDKKLLCKNLLGKLDYFISLTKNDSEKYKKYLNINAEVIPNPISFRSMEKSSLKNKNIITVGRLEYNKGSDYIVPILNEFCKLNDDWKLTIIGEGEMYTEVWNLIEKSNLQHRVSIKKFTNNIEEEYLKSSLYICTSRYESFGLAVLEAMESGLPVVTFDTSGPSELIKKDACGITVDKFDIQGFAKALNKLCQDEDLRTEKSKLALKRVNDFEIKDIVNKWNNIISR